MNTVRKWASVAAIALVTSLAGCNLMTTTGGVQSSGKLTQDQEMNFAPPLRLKITRCYWAASVNRMDDLARQGQQMPSYVSDQMTVKPQDSFLVVELAMTNYGTQPMSATESPSFELQTASGVKYQPNPDMNHFSSDFRLAGNINPGRAREGREVFDVPKGQYDLYVHLAVSNGIVTQQTTSIAGVWELTPAEGN